MKRSASLEVELQHLMRKHSLNNDDDHCNEEKSSKNSNHCNSTTILNINSCDLLENKEHKSSVAVTADAISSSKLKSDCKTELESSSKQEQCAKISIESSDNSTIKETGKSSVVCNCNNFNNINNNSNEGEHLHYGEGSITNQVIHAVKKEEASIITHVAEVDVCKSEPEEESNGNAIDSNNYNSDTTSSISSSSNNITNEIIGNANFRDNECCRKRMTGSRFDPLRTFASIVKNKPVSAKASKHCKASDTVINNNEESERYNAEQNNISTAQMEQVKMWSRCTWPLPNLLLHSQRPYKNISKLASMFRFLLVIDFEATCSANSINYPNEIIEFPVIVLDTKQLRVVAHFHSYVKPKRNPVLSAFCRTLTGISQADVDKAPYLPKVLEHFNEWLSNVVYPIASAALTSETVSSTSNKEHVNDNVSTIRCDDCTSYGVKTAQNNNLTKENDCNTQKECSKLRNIKNTDNNCAITNDKLEKLFCVATDGPWDMRHFMHVCSVQRDHVEFPELFYHFVNVKKCFSDYFKCKPTKLKSMLSKLMMNFVGKPHCGYDDAVNITRVIAELLARGYKIHKVSHIERNNNFAALDDIY